MLPLKGILYLRNTPVRANTPVLTVKLPARLAGAWDAPADLAGSLGDLVASLSSSCSSSGPLATSSCATRGAREEGPQRRFHRAHVR